MSVERTHGYDAVVLSFVCVVHVCTWWLGSKFPVAPANTCVYILVLIFVAVTNQKLVDLQGPEFSNMTERPGKGRTQG